MGPTSVGTKPLGTQKVSSRLKSGPPIRNLPTRVPPRNPSRAFVICRKPIERDPVGRRLRSGNDRIASPAYVPERNSTKPVPGSFPSGGDRVGVVASFCPGHVSPGTDPRNRLCEVSESARLEIVIGFVRVRRWRGRCLRPREGLFGPRRAGSGERPKTSVNARGGLMKNPGCQRTAGTRATTHHRPRGEASPRDREKSRGHGFVQPGRIAAADPYRVFPGGAHSP